MFFTGMPLFYLKFMVLKFMVVDDADDGCLTCVNLPTKKHVECILHGIQNTQVGSFRCFVLVEGALYNVS